ncbi:MAG: HAD-IIA family hydrolase [Nitrososphaerota archaeon]|nr:HAD-IIA family hydrolase [Nitrososphaerota archaeon]
MKRPDAVLDRVMEKKVMIFDGDGTLYIDTKKTPGAAAFLDYVAGAGKKFAIMTNNSSYSKRRHMKRIGRTLGRTLGDDELFVSTEAAADYLQAGGMGRAFIVGTPDCVEDFRLRGVRFEEDDPDAVVIAFDRTLTYGKVRRAAGLIMKGKPYILTNPDMVCPTKGGYIPDAGSIAAMIKSATNKEPMAVTGKPSKIFLDHVLRELDAESSECVMFGDRVYTDIAMANDAGVLSVLLLTGETKAKDVRGTRGPDIVIDSFGDLLHTLTRKA